MNQIRKTVVLIGTGLVLSLFVPYAPHEIRDSADQGGGFGGLTQTSILADDLAGSSANVCVEPDVQVSEGTWTKCDRDNGPVYPFMRPLEPHEHNGREGGGRDGR